MRSWGKAQPAALPGWEMSQCDLCRARGLCQGWGHRQPHQQRPLWLMNKAIKGSPRAGGSLGVPSPILLTVCRFSDTRRCGFPTPTAGGTARDPPCWHSTSNGIEEAAASPRRDLGGLRFQTGFGAGACHGQLPPKRLIRGGSRGVPASSLPVCGAWARLHTMPCGAGWEGNKDKPLPFLGT